MSLGGEPGLCFPCSFPIKAMGPAEEGFDHDLRCGGTRGEAAVKSRLATGGRYVAVTVTIEAMSQGQLDASTGSSTVTSAS